MGETPSAGCAKTQEHDAARAQPVKQTDGLRGPLQLSQLISEAQLRAWLYEHRISITGLAAVLNISRKTIYNNFRSTSNESIVYSLALRELARHNGIPFPEPAVLSLQQWRSERLHAATTAL